MDKRRVGRWLNWTFILIAAPLMLFSHVPRALAFPHQARFGQTQVLSDTPISARFATTLARADALIKASPLAGGNLSRTVVLTDGGWRWRLLALTSSDTVAFRRAFSSALVFNRSNVASDRAAGGWRSLSGTIAHETAHLLAARRVGELATLSAPGWINEGLADVVAKESPLTDAQARRTRKRNPGARRLFYYDARRRVAAALAANGNSIQALYGMTP